MTIPTYAAIVMNPNASTLSTTYKMVTTRDNMFRVSAYARGMYEHALSATKATYGEKARNLAERWLEPSAEGYVQLLTFIRCYYDYHDEQLVMDEARDDLDELFEECCI